MRNHNVIKKSSYSPDPEDFVNDDNNDFGESAEPFVIVNPDVVISDEESPVGTPSPIVMDKIEDCFDMYNSPRQRCPSFSCQLNRSLSSNVIQHHFITDEMISNTAKYAAQIACVNLSYSTYIPCSSSDPSMHHCCLVCQRSLLLAVSQFFYNNNMDDIHDLSPGMPINPSTPKFAATLQVQQGMEHSLIKILQSLRAVLHLRPTELIHALHYFDVLLKRHWMCSTFILFRQSLKTIFAVCCLIAHKMNSDNPFRNTAWSELFGMPIQTINEFERSILTLLEYETRLGPARYHQLESIVGLGEDYFITLASERESESESESESGSESECESEGKSKDRSKRGRKWGGTDVGANGNTNTSVSLGADANTNVTVEVCANACTCACEDKLAVNNMNENENVTAVDNEDACVDAETDADADADVDVEMNGCGDDRSACACACGCAVVSVGSNTSAGTCASGRAYTGAGGGAGACANAVMDTHTHMGQSGPALGRGYGCGHGHTRGRGGGMNAWEEMGA